MPDPSSARCLTLADLDDAALERLVRHGEDLPVEPKQTLPAPPQFGAAIASFANTLNGWLLIGARDDRTVVGRGKPD
jgi:predicted HTH transcriptional regulator